MDMEQQLAGFLQTYFLHVALFLFLAVSASEVLRPAHRQSGSITRRWARNFALTALNTALLRWLHPLLASAVAALVAALGVGVFNVVELPFPVVLLLSLMLLDLSQYWIHRVFHASELTWRIHRVHHSDLDFDLSTGFRFHPLEAVITTAGHMALIGVIGIPPTVILLRGLLVIYIDLFTHANIHLPDNVDRILRWVFVTPNMHALHHSAVVQESNRNFGSLLSIWDRLFGTYQAHAGKQWSALEFGISESRNEQSVAFVRMLLMPFHRLNPPSESFESTRR